MKPGIKPWSTIILVIGALFLLVERCNGAYERYARANEDPQIFNDPTETGKRHGENFAVQSTQADIPYGRPRNLGENLKKL